MLHDAWPIHFNVRQVPEPYVQCQVGYLLQDKTQAFDDFKQRDKIFKSIKATVSILTPISALVSVADDAGLVRQDVLKVCLAFLILLQKLFPHTKAIHSTIGILLDVCIIPKFIRRDLSDV